MLYAELLLFSGSGSFWLIGPFRSSCAVNRIDRLFAILVMLQVKSPVRAQDLAERFEVSERTIYRDIAAL